MTIPCQLTDAELSALSALEMLDGSAAIDLPIVATRRKAARFVRGDSARCDLATEIVVDHPHLGQVPVTIRDGRASWPYIGTACEAGGVVWKTPAQSRAVRAAMLSEGLDPRTHYAMPYVLRKHGITS